MEKHISHVRLESQPAGTLSKYGYVRLPDQLNQLAVAHGDGTLKKVIKAYQKIDLLILDEGLC